MVRRCAGLTLALEGFYDDHAPAAAGAWRPYVVRLGPRVGRRGRCNTEQLAYSFEMRLAGGAGEQAVVTDAVEALWQNVEQEAADELVGGQRHDLLAVSATPAVILITEGDAGLVEAKEPAVRDRHTVGVA